MGSLSPSPRTRPTSTEAPSLAARILLRVVLVASLSPALGCDDKPAPHPEPVAAPAPKPRPTVIFETAKGPVPVVVDVADTDAKRTRGLMYVESLERGRGMVFLMPSERIQTFWMKNTLIPLDMIFVDSKMKVVGVVAQAEPRTLVPRSVDLPSRYVVEVKGGYAAEVGITAGVAVRFEHIL